MWTLMKRVAVVKLLLFATIGVVFVVGMRRKHPAVLGAVRRTNRAVFNPMQMKSAGTPGAYASVIHHVGRASGNEYRTPVGAVSTDDGFVIALPYGTEADWLKNVLAAGTATLVHEGETHPIHEVTVAPIEEFDESFSDQDRRAHRWFGVDQVAHLR